MRVTWEVESNPRMTTPCKAWVVSTMPARSWRKATWATSWT